MRASVSVIMPVRNAGGFLESAVHSILSQTHQNLELLLVDDFSTDSAIADLECDDPRLKVIASRGRGVANAFNTGLGFARGRYIARMDADDVATPERLKLQLGLLETDPGIAIAGGCVEIFSGHEVAAGSRHYQAWLNSVRSPGEIHRQMFVESPIPNPTAMFRRDVIRNLGGYRDTLWPEDYDLYLRADQQGLKMAKPPEVVLKWRDHGGRLTRTDPRYTIESFRRAKVHFLAGGRIEPEGILIWGAGPTGRAMHDLLAEQGVKVEGFVDVHPRRIGGSKRGLPVWPLDKAASWDRGMVLVAVGARGARDEIREYMTRNDKVEGVEYLFVA